MHRRFLRPAQHKEKFCDSVSIGCRQTMPLLASGAVLRHAADSLILIRHCGVFRQARRKRHAQSGCGLGAKLSANAIVH